MNRFSFEVITRKILLLAGCLVLAMILGACTNEKESSHLEYKEQYYEGKSDNWHVKMESKVDSERSYFISYIGEGNKPFDFKYEIYESSSTPSSFGEGELKNQEQFDIYINCGGPCDAIPDNVPIQIEWEGKKEEVVIRNKE